MLLTNFVEFYQPMVDKDGPNFQGHDNGNRGYNENSSIYINATFFILFPKIRIAEKIRDWDPISLSNLRYKIIVKMLVNRL